VFLDVFDTGEYTKTGGTLTEFTIAFGGDQRHCINIPAPFQPRKNLRLTIP